jgi:hypothetical protein
MLQDWRPKQNLCYINKMKYPNSETSMSNVYMKKPFMYKHQFSDREITAVDLSIGKCNNTLCTQEGK